jgi:hypothetical protein
MLLHYFQDWCRVRGISGEQLLALAEGIYRQGGAGANGK